MTFQSGSGHLRCISFVAKSKVGANRNHFVWRLRQLRAESLPATKGVFHSTEKSANFQWNQMEQKFPGIKSRNFRYRPREVVLKFRKIGNPGRFPFNQNFRFGFPATSSSEWNSIFRLTAPIMTIFRHFQKRGQPLEVYPNFRKKFPGSFLSILLCSRNF